MMQKHMRIIRAGQKIINVQLKDKFFLSAHARNSDSRDVSDTLRAESYPANQ